MIKLSRLYITLLSLTIIVICLLSSISVAKQITTTDLLQDYSENEPLDKRVLRATKTVMFTQTNGGTGGAASVIQKINLSYFTTSNCTTAATSTATSGGTYTIPSYTSPAYTFGLVAASTWLAGKNAGLSNANMEQVQSIAVTLKRSATANTPQANFSGLSYACITPVSCLAANGTCTSTIGTRSFILKENASVGDPADGGIIACNSGGDLNVVVPTTDNNSAATIYWSLNTAIVTAATSTTNGSNIGPGGNTYKIVQALSPAQAVGTYAAGICSIYSAAGGFTSGWFLPAGGTGAGTQQNCIYTNKTAIDTGAAVSGGSAFASTGYWSSTEANSTTSAWFQNFGTGAQSTLAKTNFRRIRCARNF